MTLAKEFSSPYPVDDSGVTNIPVESPVFTQSVTRYLTCIMTAIGGVLMQYKRRHKGVEGSGN